MDGSQKEILEILKVNGYQGKITPDTYVYENKKGEDVVMEKRGRDTYPIDEGDSYNGYYVDSFAWDSNGKLAEIEAAGGRGAQSRHNIRKANEALRKL